VHSATRDVDLCWTQKGPGAQPLVRGSVGEAPVEAESLIAF